MDSMTYKFNSTGSSKVVSFHGFWQLRLPPHRSGRAAERTTQPLPTGVDDLTLMERDLLSRVTGDSGRQRLQDQGQGQENPRPPPSPTLSLRVGTDANRGHRHEPQHAQPAATVVAANVVSSLLPSSSRVQLAPAGRLASVVVPGCPISERRHNLRTAGGDAARSQATASAGMPPVQEQQRASPAAPGPGSGPGPGQERCDACGLSARLLQGLSSDLDRARAQVALLTCQNESLRHRLKRASASASAPGPGPECPAAASAPRLNLRCGACRVRPATVLLASREHLCLCGHCAKSSRDGGAALACPVCRGAVGAWLAEGDPR